MNSRIRGLMEKSIWKKNDKDDFRDCEKKLIYADYGKIPEGLSVSVREAASEILSGQEEARSGMKKRAARNAPRVMKYTVSLTEKITGAEIDELDLCSRSQNALKREGIMTVGNLLEKIVTPDQIGCIRQLGEKSRADVFWQLFSFHYTVLPAELRKKYVRECAALDDPPKETPDGRSGGGVDLEGFGEKILSADVTMYADMELSETEKDIVDALMSGGITGCFAYPVYLTGELENMDLEELPLSVRAFHCLKRGGYNTVGDFLADTDGVGILPIRNCGAKSTGEIYARMFLVMASLLSKEQRKKYLEIVTGGVFGT